MSDEVTSGEILRRFDRFEEVVRRGFDDIKNDYVRRDVWQEARSADMREVARLAGEAKDTADAAAEKSTGWRNYFMLPVASAVIASVLSAGLTVLFFH